MTGSDVTALREALGLNAHQMAALLGVSVSTIYRWEKTLSGGETLDPLQRELLEGLRQIVKTAPKSARSLGQEIARAVLNDGTLGALLVAITAILKERK